MRIIYRNTDNSVGVLIPTQEAINMIIDAKTKDWDSPFSLNESLLIIAEKDVPKNLPYWIVSVSDIPTDRTDRDRWTLDGTEGDPDGFGGESNEFTDEQLKEFYNQGVIK